MLRGFRHSLLLAAMVLTAHAAAQSAGATEPDRWPKFVENFVERYFEFNPTIAVAAGKHAFDGRLPDWSPAGIKEYTAWLARARGQALAFAPDRLNGSQRFERDYLLAVIDGALFWLTSADWHRKNPYFYSPVLDPDVYISREYAPPATRMKAYIEYAKNVPTAARQIRQNMSGPIPRPFAELGVAMFGGLSAFYEKDAPRAFASVSDESLQAEFRGANARAIEAMRELTSHLGKLTSTADHGFALGEKKFREMMWTTERVDESVQKLERAGRESLERDLASLKSACAELLPNAGIEACIAHVQSRKPAGGVVEAAQRQIGSIRSFIVDRKIVTIPAGGSVVVRETPEYARGNLAGITNPGPFEQDPASFYNISPPNVSWPAAEQAAYVPGEASLLFITVHEVFPGHFVHSLHRNKLESQVGQIFIGFGFSEGWAHYAEEMMWEEGLGNKSPEMRVAQLLLALLRDVRLLVAIGLHTGDMTVADAERMFRELAFQDPGNARQQAIRGTFDPSYALYTIGKLKVIEMRKDWFRLQAKRSDLQDFHDALLSLGSPPLGLAKQRLREIAKR